MNDPRVRQALLSAHDHIMTLLYTFQNECGLLVQPLLLDDDRRLHKLQSRSNAQQNTYKDKTQN